LFFGVERRAGHEGRLEQVRVVVGTCRDVDRGVVAVPVARVHVRASHQQRLDAAHIAGLDGGVQRHSELPVLL
jgi:hypothetical protein